MRCPSIGRGGNTNTTCTLVLYYYLDCNYPFITAGVPFLPAGAEAELAAGSPLLSEAWSQPAEYQRPWGGALCSAGPPRGLWVGVNVWPGERWCNMMIMAMTMIMWPTGSQRTMSSTGFGSDWTEETPWTTAAGSGAMGSLWVLTRCNLTVAG